MAFAFFPGLRRALALGLVLAGAVVAAAQRAPAKIKTKNKTRTQTRISVARPAPAVPPAAGPIPVSPLSSSPQVLLPAEDPAAWFGDLAAAQAQARATGRPVVAVFSGSDWCAPCVVFEREVFAQPAFSAFAQGRLVLAHFDYPRQPGHQLPPAQARLNAAAAAQLNREGDFPLAVVLAPDGRVLAKTGYRAGGPAAFVAYLKTVAPGL